MKKITSLMSILVIMALVIFPISAFALIGDGKSIEIDSMKKVDKSQDKYTFSFENTNNNRYVVIKQSTKAIVWTEKEVATLDQKEFTKDLRELAAKKDKSLLKAIDSGKVFYIFGEGNFDLKSLDKTFGTYKFSIDGKKVILETNASKISHAVYGTYTNENDPKPEEPAYVWKEVGVVSEDTATGFLEGANYKANPNSNNWFQAQEIDLSLNKEVDINIQAGNFKNGTNFVGKLKLIKNDNLVTMNYKVLDELSTLPDVSGYNLGDKVTITTLNGPKYLASIDKIAISNNGKDLNKFENGDSF